MWCATPAVLAAPKLKEGAYRVDWNRKVRDLCVDTYSNDDLSARDWQGVMAALGVVCTLTDVRAKASGAPAGVASARSRAWGACSASSIG